MAIIWSNCTGADGIALSADRKTPVRGERCCPPGYVHTSRDHRSCAIDLGDKGTNTDGLGADNKGLIYYTMLEGQGIGIYNPVVKTFTPFISDERMIWVDGMTFDNKRSLVFNSNRLHELFGDDLDWKYEYNFVIH